MTPAIYAALIITVIGTLVLGTFPELLLNYSRYALFAAM